MEVSKLDWADAWKRFDAVQRQAAAEAFIQRLRSPDGVLPENYPSYFTERLAKRMRFRPQTLKRIPPAQLAAELCRYVPLLFKAFDWRLLFATYYTTHRRDLLCRFLDLLGLEHDERGLTSQAPKLPEDLQTVVDTLTKEFSPQDVATYFLVLTLGDARWSFLEPLLPQLLVAPDAASAAEENAEQADSAVEEVVAEEASESFTQLDRVLIQQIIATVAGEERALTPAQLIDLVETVHALDTTRKRTYFHLGYLDALLPGREPSFDRPEMEDERRQWYLAGLLTGFARKRDAEQFRHWLAVRKDDFARAAAVPGKAGAAMGKTLFRYLLDLGLLPEALDLLAPQLQNVGMDMAHSAYDKACELLRAGDTAGANSLLPTLLEQLKRMVPGNDAARELLAKVKRKLGQVYQAQSKLPEATRIFNDLLNEQDHAGDPAELLADLGLVEGGFRSLAEVDLPDDPDRRSAVRDALKRGETHFAEAVERFGVKAVNANYALAVLRYLECMPGGNGEPGNEKTRELALKCVEDAISGMTSSAYASSYEDLGLLGRARFMQAVLLMLRLDTAVVSAARSAWNAIGDRAGRLPAWDLRQYLDHAELQDRTSAIEITESIWRHRKLQALEFIRQASVDESEYLREELLAHARKDTLPADVRWDLWSILIPSLIRNGNTSLAQEGLDALEGLAMEEALRFGERMLQWLDQRENYDPLWREEDVLRLRYQLYRRLGRDDDAHQQLRALFYCLRDQRPEEAKQVLELFEEINAPHDRYSDLVLPLADRGDNELRSHSVEERLRNGERVKVLFIGGNEIQARYDAMVRDEIKAKWPGVEIEFEHTGWSSNWGRELESLKKAARESDAVVLMTMMRTMLGCSLRQAMNDPPRPWVPCTGTGKQALVRSIREAAVVALRNRNKVAVGAT